jgi:tRNA A-37 threonylcarbamoyl transferase component Bud32
VSDEGRLIAGRYSVIDRIGRGGMGTVWRVHDTLLGRQVAVKKLHPHPHLPEDELATLFERSRREARSIARISHPNVVVVHDVVDDEGSPAIVMEYVASTTLAELIEARGPVPPEEAAKVGLGVLAALRAAHRAGVLHRDVKPANVLLAEDGRVVLTDFGIAQAADASTLTVTGQFVGSVDFIAPERLTGGKPGPESDLWALGATLFQAVEGRSPFRRDTVPETLYAITKGPVPEIRRAGPLTALIQGLIAHEPGERLSAEEAERLLRTATGEGHSTVAVPAVPAVRAEPSDVHEPAPEDGQREATAGGAAPDSSPTTSAGRWAQARSGRWRKPVVLSAAVAALVLIAIPLRVTLTGGESNPGSGASAPATSHALVVASSAKCLSSGEGAEGTQLFQETCDGAAEQQWRIGSGTIRSSGKCVTVAGGSTANGTAIQLAGCDGRGSQRFRLDGTQLVAEQTQKCVDILGGESGTVAVLWECNGRDNQSWKPV